MLDPHPHSYQDVVSAAASQSERGAFRAQLATRAERPSAAEVARKAPFIRDINTSIVARKCKFFLQSQSIESTNAP
jgi:hypothetical protein